MAHRIASLVHCCMGRTSVLADAYVRRWEWAVIHMSMASMAVTAQASAQPGAFAGRPGNAFSVATAIAVNQALNLVHDCTDCCHAGLRCQPRALTGGAWPFQSRCAQRCSCNCCQSGDGLAAAQAVPAARQRHAAGAVASSGPHAHGRLPDHPPLHVPNTCRLRLQLIVPHSQCCCTSGPRTP